MEPRGGSLKATAAYNESDNHTLQDGDGTAIRFTASTFANKAKQRYAELIYTSDPARAFTWVVGVNAYDEHLTQALAVPTQGYPLYTAGGMLDTTAYAGFAHGEYKVGAAKVFAGLRYSDDRKVMSEYNAFIGVNDARASFSKLTYEAGLTYALSEEVTGYAKYATGYKSGGFAMGALAPGFRPETNAAYEAGLKRPWQGRGRSLKLTARSFG